MTLPGKIKGYGVAKDSDGNIKYDPHFHKVVKDDDCSLYVHEKRDGGSSGGQDRRGERRGED